jgi:hypothetical protein
MRVATVTALVLVLVLSACGERGRSPAQDAAVPPPAASTVPQPSDVAPAPPAPPPASGAVPAPGIISYAGFGPAPFGANEEQVRIAWGRDLGGMKPDTAAGCYYLMPQPRTQRGYRVAFMFEDQRFVRMDVDADDIPAPGGGRVGMSAQEIERLYAGHVQVQPHKYVEGGKYLRVPNPGGGSGVVLFETDGTGRVTAWRIGEPPQVDYVEGCS